MKKTSTWTDEVLSGMQESGKRIYLLRLKINAYDRANWWRKMRMGWLVYRVFLKYCYMSELYYYISAYLKARDSKYKV